MREFPRPRYLIGVVIVAMLLLSPSVASAQRVIPHAFLGSATINGSPAADGTVVVIHDTDLKRITGLGEKIWNVTYDEIRELDFGSWF